MPIRVNKSKHKGLKWKENIITLRVQLISVMQSVLNLLIWLYNNVFV
jgi:hypothetical protein